MNAEIFAEWLRRQGHKVLKTQSSYWVEAVPRVYQAFPYHWIITPGEDEIKRFMLDVRAVCLRYSAPIEASEGMLSYHGVLCDKSYSLETLSANARSKVRRGLKRSRIDKISLSQLAQDGWRLQADTIERQGRLGSMNRKDWQRVCLSANGLPGFEVRAAYVGKDLAATILTAQVEDVCYMLYPQSHRKYFGDYVNNALCYELTRDMLARNDIKEIFYGLHSLDAPASVDEFKFRMGYIAKAVRQRVAFNPLINLLVNRSSYALLRIGRKVLPSNSLLAKAEGMFWFYIQGKLPITSQVSPEPLQEVNFA